MLSWLLVVPFLGAGVLLFVGKNRDAAVLNVTRATTLLMTALSLLCLRGFDASAAESFHYQVSCEWIPSLGVRFALGVDGISLVLILLTGFLAPIAAFASESAIKERRREFFFWFLVLHGAMVGALMARDLFLFFVFWELMLIPMALMIGIWGSDRRLYASLKFFLYTVVGSLPMLAALVYVALKQARTGTPSLLISDLAAVDLSSSEQFWCFLAFALSFAIKVPLWPVHTWLPDAHTQAPTPGSVLLAGVLLKMGGYGFIRIAIPLFPEAARNAAPTITTLAVIAIIAGSLVAMMQVDIKRLVAYSSVAHMGAVMLGIFSLNEEGLNGATYMMLGHGLSTGGLFLLVGILYERRHTRLFEDYGGIAKTMPIFASCFVFMTMASIALPGLCGFPGEFLILVGAYKASPVLAAFAVTGAILGAWYMLSAVRRILFGEITKEENERLQDLKPREIGILAPLMLAIVLLGVGSELFLSRFRGDLKESVVTRVEAPSQGD